jgi:hypothetical protein
MCCSTANYVGASDVYGIIEEEFIGTNITYCLFKGTLRRKPWVAFCVQRSGGGERAAIMVHPKAASLMILEQQGE